MVGLVSGAFIGLWRLLYTGHGSVTGLNQPLEPELVRLVPHFGSHVDPSSCLEVLQKLCAATEELHPQLAALGVDLPREMPGHLARLIAELSG
jgi:hypothetical protein